MREVLAAPAAPAAPVRPCREAPSEGEANVLYASLLDWTSHSRFRGDLTRSFHRQYLFISRGGGSARIDEVTWSLEPGLFIVVPESAQFLLTLEMGTQGIWLAGAADFMTHGVASALFLNGSEHWLSYHAPKRIPLFASRTDEGELNRVQAELESVCARLGRGCDIAVVAYVFVVLTVNRGGQWNLPEVHKNDAFQFVEDPSVQILLRFRGMIEQHFRDHLSVNDFARKLGITPNRLTRLCIDLTDRSPLAVVHQRLMREARRMLANSPAKVAEIAYELGFADPAYFSRFFRRNASVSPARFRMETVTARRLPRERSPRPN